MRIGIITFWESKDNYGQILQAYALQRFLRNKGHAAYVIRYRNSVKRNLIWWLKLPLKIARYLYLITFQKSEYELNKRFKAQRKLIEEENAKHPRNFNSFKEKYIQFSDNIYDYHSLFENPPEADAFIAGSDQIWRGLSPVFYLQFVPKGKLCIAYAPSFGGIEFTHKQLEVLKKYLKRFSILGMREQYGVELCQKAGRNDALLVADPTLLLSKDNYNQILVPSNIKDDYLFLYLLGNDMALDISSVYEWAKKQNLKVVYVASQGRFDDYEKMYPNVDEWLGLIKDAKYVVTNSFHGTVFSIIMNKQFVTIPLIGAFSKMNGRIFDLLSKLKLENRIYSNNLDILLKPILFDNTNYNLSMNRDLLSNKFDIWLMLVKN